MMKFYSSLKTLMVIFLLSGCGIEFNYSKNLVTAINSQNNIHNNASHVWAEVNNIGSGSISIVPKTAIPLSGFGSLARRILPPRAVEADSGSYMAPFTSVEVAPRAKLFLFSGVGGTGVNEIFALFNIDVVGVSPDFKYLLYKALRSRFGDIISDPSQVQVIATHTHSGPAGLSEDPMFSLLAGDKLITWYRNWVIDNMVILFEQVSLGAKKLDSINVFQSEVAESHHSRMPDLPVEKNTVLYNFLGEQNNTCMIMFASHSTFYGTKSRILSADIAGSVEQAFELKTNSKLCMLLPISVANATASTSPKDTLQSFALKMNTEFESNKKAATNLSFASFEFGTRELSLPEASINYGGCGVSKFFGSLINLEFLKERPRKTSLSYLKIGQDLWVFFPGETASDLTTNLRQYLASMQSDIKNIYIVSTSNDYIGYIMSRDEYKKESMESCSALYDSSLYNEVAEVIRSLF